MKQVGRYTAALCIICVVYIGTPGSAFSREDYIHWNLPDDVIARVGKGNVGTGDRSIAFSPDGKLLAVASGIGSGSMICILRRSSHCSPAIPVVSFAFHSPPMERH